MPITHITALAFREAAEQAEPFPHWVKLFLAAAAQREQLDDLQRKYDNTRQWGLDANRWIQECDPFLKDGERPAECIARNRADIDLLLKQIATLTAERDAAHQFHADYLAEITRSQDQLCARIATLTKERDEARAWVRTFATRLNDEPRYCPQCGQSCLVRIDPPPFTVRPQFDEALAQNVAQQVRTLTADVAQQVIFAQELAEEYAGLEAEYDKGREALATLTAERDAARADLHQTNERYYAATDEITNLTHERDAARATIAQVRDWMAGVRGYALTHIAFYDAFVQLAERLDAPTQPA